MKERRETVLGGFNCEDAGYAIWQEGVIQQEDFE